MPLCVYPHYRPNQSQEGKRERGEEEETKVQAASMIASQRSENGSSKGGRGGEVGRPSFYFSHKSEVLERHRERRGGRKRKESKPDSNSFP